jgi:hypothetical protein
LYVLFTASGGSDVQRAPVWVVVPPLSPHAPSVSADAVAMAAIPICFSALDFFVFDMASFFPFPVR